MTETVKNYLKVAGVALAMVVTIVALILSVQTQKVEAGITHQQPVLVDTFVNQDFFPVATTTSATSTNAANLQDRTVRIDGAEQATFYFSRGGATSANTGSTKFEVEVSPDGTNWYDFSRLYITDSAKTATSTVWITAATTTVMASMDLEMNAFRFARCVIIEVTDGEHDCSVSVEY